MPYSDAEVEWERGTRERDVGEWNGRGKRGREMWGSGMGEGNEGDRCGGVEWERGTRERDVGEWNGRGERGREMWGSGMGEGNEGQRCGGVEWERGTRERDVGEWNGRGERGREMWGSGMGEGNEGERCGGVETGGGDGSETETVMEGEEKQKARSSSMPASTWTLRTRRAEFCSLWNNIVGRIHTRTQHCIDLWRTASSRSEEE